MHRDIDVSGPADEPVLDEDGLLWVGSRWVAIPIAQIPIVELLLSRYRKVVRIPTITEVYVAAGQSGTIGSIRSLRWRLADRLRNVGLTVQTVRGRGLILCPLPSA